MSGRELEIDVSLGPGYLRVALDGTMSRVAADRVAARVRTEMAAKGVSRVLVDVSRQVGLVTPGDAFELGGDIARLFFGTARLAILAPDGLADPFFETVVLNRGGNIATFADEASAVAWLTAP